MSKYPEAEAEGSKKKDKKKKGKAVDLNAFLAGDADGGSTVSPCSYPLHGERQTLTDPLTHWPIEPMIELP